MSDRKSILFLSEWHDSRLQTGVAMYAKEAGWHLVLDPLFENYLPWGWDGDGCLLNVYSKPYLDYAETLGMPIVNMSANAVISSAVNVVEDNRAYGNMAAHHFLDQGFKNFATLRTDSRPIAMDRIIGFETEVSEQELSCDNLSYTKAVSCSNEDWKRQKGWLVDQLKRLALPTAIFCVDDRLAVKVVEAAGDADLSIPEELSVMGVGNLEIACECSTVPITSINIDPVMQGYRAAQVLDRLMKGEGGGTPERFQPVEVIQRRSTDTMAAEDPVARKAIRFILDHYPQDIGVDEIAQGIDCPRRKLNYVFQKEFGKGPGKILEAIRLKKAREHLMNSNDSIDLIAQLTGFGSYLRLIRVFKRHYGVTPGEFRKKQ